MQPLDLHRVSKCTYCRVKPTVGVNLNPENKNAFYSNVSVCGSVWGCPVCAAKIQEKRRKEISQVMASAYANGYSCHMITLTFPHMAYQSCGELLDIQADALTRLRKGDAFTGKYLKDKLGYAGVVRSLEVVHGRNGWHPHTHELWVVRSDADVSELRKRVAHKWVRALINAGALNAADTRKIKQVLKHGVDVHFNADSSDYLAKHDDQSYLQARNKQRSGQWGADHELAKSSAKGKSTGRHPFQILADFQDKPNKRDAQLFISYLEAFTERRKRQLYIAPALRKMAGLTKAKDDKELAEESPSEYDFLGSLDLIDWQMVVANRAQSLILDIAEKEGFKGVKSWLLDHGGGFHILESVYNAVNVTAYVRDRE